MINGDGTSVASSFMTGAAPGSYRTARFASRARQINVRATDEQRKITGNVTITTHALLPQNALHIELEGTVAHWAAHLLALDHRVVDVQSEPMTIYYNDGDGEKRYHPDLLVTYRAGQREGILTRCFTSLNSANFCARISKRCARVCTPHTLSA